MKKRLTLYCSWICNSLKCRNKLHLKSIWQNKVAFTKTCFFNKLWHQMAVFTLYINFSYWKFFLGLMFQHATTCFIAAGMLPVNVSHPFVWSIQGMNCAENSLDSWTYPKSCNTTYCGQTDPVHNCTLGIIKLLSENNASLVSEEFNTCTVIVWVWQREKRLHTSANKWSQLAHTQSVVYVWNSTPPY